MGYNHLRIKSNAKLFYKNNQGWSIVAVLILLGIPYASGMVLGIIVYVVDIIAAAAVGIGIGGSGGAEGTGWAFIGMLSILLYITAIALSLVVGAGTYVLTMGVQSWFRRSIYEKTSLKEIFMPFISGKLWSNIGMCLLVQLYTFLWSMLFVIPGIVKAISYSMAVYIKAENPDISPSRAIELSKMITEGHKWDLFYLNLSFLGWFILSSLTYNILGIVYVFPYFYAARAFAYEEIKADAASRGVLNIYEIQKV